MHAWSVWICICLNSYLSLLCTHTVQRLFVPSTRPPSPLSVASRTNFSGTYISSAEHSDNISHTSLFTTWTLITSIIIINQQLSHSFHHNSAIQFNSLFYDCNHFHTIYLARVQYNHTCPIYLARGCSVLARHLTYRFACNCTACTLPAISTSVRVWKCGVRALPSGIYFVIIVEIWDNVWITYYLATALMVGALVGACIGLLATSLFVLAFFRPRKVWHNDNIDNYWWMIHSSRCYMLCFQCYCCGSLLICFTGDLLFLIFYSIILYCIVFYFCVQRRRHYMMKIFQWIFGDQHW